MNVTLSTLAIMPGLCACGWLPQATAQAVERPVVRENRPQHDTVSVLVFLRERVNLDALSARLDARRVTLRARHATVVRSLRDKAHATQDRLIAHLAELQRHGLIAHYRRFWIANAIRVDAAQAVIDRLAAHPDVEQIYPNLAIKGSTPVDARPDVGSPPPRAAGARTIEPGVTAVRADEVWALGYHGAGVLVASIDTGVDGQHPALADRWAGLLPQYAGHPEWAWYDPYTNQNDFPFEGGSGHGTHTMGTLCGGPPGDAIGVAPGAVWIAAGAIERGGSIPETIADAMASLQWMVDPDGNPDTHWDVPVVCSNSWGVTTTHGVPPCDELLWSSLDACEAAGVVVLFSAGGGGPEPNSLWRPADRATDEYRTLAVGAVAAGIPGWPVASFSSRGPSYCTPSGDAAIKPEVAAPGVDVRSAAPGNGYSFKSGTSMAAPHVGGVIALMRDACPNLTVAQVKQVLYDTAVDLGSPGQDNAYGWGMVDAYEAVLRSLELCEPVGDLDGDGDVDVVDLVILITAWGPNPQHPADVNGSGVVDVEDLVVLIAAWTPQP